MRGVSRPAWATVIADLAGGEDRRSPVEVFASMSSAISNHRYAKFAGLRESRFGRWTDGVNALRLDCKSFASYWLEYNERVLSEHASDPGPLWVAVGDSTAQGLGAPGPHGGYVGQALQELRRRTGQPWRVLNLSVSGSLIRDVLNTQLPKLPSAPDLVTCGVGANDVYYSSPSRLFSDMRVLLKEVPDGTVMLDLPLPSGMWGPLGRATVPYIRRINRLLHESAGERGLPVGRVSENFMPPWAGKFGADSFHPSQDGYRDWSRALLSAIPAALPAPAEILRPERPER